MIDLSAPVDWNIRQVARAKELAVEELTVVILDRDRNTQIADEVRAAAHASVSSRTATSRQPSPPPSRAPAWT
jgi:fructose-1,6-bisphosphatase/sedoheptulose 1,7-bisphosphatase-like protein